MTLYLIISGIIAIIFGIMAKIFYNSGKNSIVNKQNEKTLDDLQKINAKAAETSSASDNTIRDRMQKYIRD